MCCFYKNWWLLIHQWKSKKNHGIAFASYLSDGDVSVMADTNNGADSTFNHFDIVIEKF